MAKTIRQAQRQRFAAAKRNREFTVRYECPGCGGPHPKRKCGLKHEVVTLAERYERIINDPRS